MERFPIAVGGVGGSGTRLFAWTLMQLGVELPGPLNKALDNLWFTLLFKRRQALTESDEEFKGLVDLFLHRMLLGVPPADVDHAVLERIAGTSRDGHPTEQLRSYADSLLASDEASRLAPGARFGWKEPNTHIFVDRILKALPDCRYIHVMRHGFDMAFSKNQNQHRIWGETLLGRPLRKTPSDSLAYWCAVNRRIDRLAAQFPGRILVVKFEDLCLETAATVDRIAAFADVNVTANARAVIDGYCAPPPSLGRYKAEALDVFAPMDVEYVASKGYGVQ